MRVTLKDIAARVGVSEQAVSYALKGVPKVSAALRERILAESARLGYLPHLGARAMASGSFGAVTLIQDAKGGYGFLSGALLRAIVEATDAGGRQLHITRVTREQMEDRAPLPVALRQRSADGYLVNCGMAVPAAFDAVLKRCGVPAVWLNVRRSADCVHPDDRGAAELLVRALHARGCRRIAYYDGLAEEPDEHYSKVDRHAGYCDAMRALGLEPLALRCRGGGPHGHRIRALAEWLPAQEGVDALIGYSAQELDVYAHLVRPRLAGGKPLRLASFFSRHQQMVVPALRAELPAQGMAEAALAMLDRKLAKPRGAQPATAVPFALVEPDPPLDWDP